jgi:hypothetical protein
MRVRIENFRDYIQNIFNFLLQVFLKFELRSRPILKFIVPTYDYNHRHSYSQIQTIAIQRF